MNEQSFESWTSRLTNQDMPLFARTVQCVSGIAGRDDSSVSELALSVLQDPSLTTHMLKMSNSVYYNPAARRINTVSRAIMRLGFDTVKSMCLSIALVETVLCSLHRERVAQEIARAFHAATQAKELAASRKLALPEEVFIAALLSRIGQIAFWCFAGEEGDDLERAIGSGVPEAQAEMEVLGFRLEELTLALCRRWSLSDLLESMLCGGKLADPRVQSIDLGYNLAHSAETGWNAPETLDLIKKVGGFLDISEAEATKVVHEKARDAAEITESYGAMQSSRLIPLPATPLEQVPREETPPREFPEPDQQVHFQALRSLSMLLVNGQADVNQVLAMLMEGVYHGGGMDRVLFALLSQNRQYLKGKFGLGWEIEAAARDFKIAAAPPRPNVFSSALQSNNPIWVSEDPPPKLLNLITKEVVEQTGGAPFFVMQISVRGQPIGIVYADRGESGRELDKESFDNFTLLALQANMVLSYQQPDLAPRAAGQAGMAR